MIYILLATFFYTGVIIFATIASRGINPNIVTAISNISSGIIPLLLIVPLLNKKVFENGKLGILAAIAAGLCIAFFALAFNKSLQTSKIAVVSPLVFGGAIFLSAILSFVLFKEKTSIIHLSGLALLGMGLLTIIYAAYTGK